MAVQGPTAKQQVVIDHYLQDPSRNATKAAAAAGYANPRVDGSRILRRYRQLVESKLEEQSERVGMKSEQVLTEIAQIATDPTHKDRLRALELMAKINGLMSDKLQGDPKTLKQQLEEMLKPIPTSQAESKRRIANPKLVLIKTG